MFLVLGIWGFIKLVKKRRKIIRKRMFFKRNGGFLLKQQLTTREGGNVETSKIFSSKDLEKPRKQRITSTRTGFLGKEVKALSTKV